MHGLAHLFALAAFAGPSPVLAQPEPPAVLVFEDPARTRPDFATVATIQLTGTAVVERAGVVEGAGLADRVASTAHRTRERRAVAGAWIEPGDVEGELRMIVVGPRDGRALIDIVRSPRDEGWDADRTLALKLREIVERVGETQDAVALAKALPETAVAGTGPIAQLGLVTHVGGFGATGSGDVGGQLGVAFGLSVAWRAEPVQLETGASLRVPTVLDMRDEALGQIEVSEVVPEISVAVTWDMGGVLVGGRIGSPLRIVRARGTTRAGRQGTAIVAVPAVTGGLVGRLPLAGPVAAQLEAGVEVALDDRELGLNGRSVGSLGRGRAYGLVSLVISVF